MLEVENVEVFNLEGAIRGMRNPMNSWNRSDSYYGCSDDKCDYCICQEECLNVYHNYHVGKNDLELMQKLYKGGTEHRKYLRQIGVSMDIVAPLYWWKGFDTYKVGVTSNSCSTMHKIHAKEFTLDDFSHENMSPAAIATLSSVIDRLNLARKYYNKKVDRPELDMHWKTYWWDMIMLLPSSYNQRRTITMNYENAVNIINQRSNHKLDEWHILIKELKEQCPHLEAIMSE